MKLGRIAVRQTPLCTKTSACLSWVRFPFIAVNLFLASDLKMDTPVATLPGAWRYRVSAGTGWPGVSIL